jgi:hypothetical protein
MDARQRAIANALAGVPDVETENYHKALGEFVTKFASVEGDLQHTLWKLAGLKFPVAQAVLSGVRTEDAIKRIYRLIDAKGWPPARKAKFKYIADQIQEINKLRNDILHHGADLQADDTWISSNKKFVHLPDRIRNTISSQAILLQAGFDLMGIRMRLTRVFGRHPKQYTDVLDRLLAPAWRYKPAPQSPPAQTNPKGHRKRKRRRKSSPV